ncbi:hypothetical protein COLSTE_01824 [Collinsella stercoris DSM 13279]|uniref:Uncharacterized protein n=1 Tax=Collinsella stercoris DSM 13279 TaxID=445975 RepID=B6GCK1_9ACTN|nr:hypothetical protein COLSTE_01824 [Collinsella stercoris DSM 13279]
MRKSGRVARTPAVFLKMCIQVRPSTYVDGLTFLALLVSWHPRTPWPLPWVS